MIGKKEQEAQELTGKRTGRLFGSRKAAPEKREKKIRKKGLIKRVLIAAVLLCIVGGAVIHGMGRKNTLLQIPAVRAEVGTIETTVNTSGVVESEISSVYYAPLNAKVAKVNVEKGDAVQAGELLLTYDTEDLEFTQREGALEAAASENSYKSAIAESDKQQQIYETSTQALADLESMILAQRDFIDDLKKYVTDERAKRRLELLNERYKLSRQQNGIAVNMQIQPDGKITDSMYSAEYEIKNKLDEVDRKIEALELNKELTEIEQQIVKEQERLEDLLEYKAELKGDQSAAENGILDSYKKKELEASAQRTKITEERAQAHLNEAKNGIVAEFDGIVTELNVRDGFVTDQSSRLMTVESSEQVRVNVALSKYDLAKVTEGQKAEVTIAGNVYEGTVSKINHMAEPNDAGTRLVMAQVHVDNPDERIYLGIEGKVVIRAQKAEQVLTVPIAAVNTDQGGDFCYVVENGLAKRRSVQVGLSSESSIEIQSGLQAGDIVLTDSSMILEEGIEVEPLLEETVSEAPAEAQESEQAETEQTQ